MTRLLLSIALLAVVSEAAAQTPAGGAFALNTYLAGSQGWPVIGIEPDGDFVAVWQSVGQDGSATGIFGQRHARNGVRRGGEFQVNTFTTGYQTWYGRPAIAADRSGDFVVVWASLDQDGDGWGVFAQRFASTGGRLGGEFQVNSYTTGHQGGTLLFYNSIAVDTDPRGNFVVVWAADQDGDASGVYAQRYDSAGTRLGGEFRVNTSTAGYQVSPTVSVNDGGGFVVAWSTPDGSGSGVAARRFDAAGGPVGGEFQVNTYTTGDQAALLLPPVVALSDNGTFVVVWDSLSGQDGAGYGVFGRRFDAANTPLGPEFQVNTYTTGNQAFPWVDGDEVGNFVVAWGSNGIGANYEVFGQRFLASGAPRGGEFQVNTFTPGVQGLAHVGADLAGNFVIAWHGSTDGSGRGTFGQRFGGLFPAAAAVDTSGNTVLEPGETVDVRPSWLNVNGSAQTLTGVLSTPGGPPGGLPIIVDGVGAYGTVPDGATAACTDCYTLSVPAPSPRPALHWDATAVEAILPDVQGQMKIWRLHVGASFVDVPSSNPFYRFVETLLHHGITGGCSATQYCPISSTTREQMAVFVLVAKDGAGYAPTACGSTPMFADVPVTSPFCRWVEELARRGVVAGCGGGNYCPSAPVSREQMAVFVLRTLDPALDPPACAPPNLFADVPQTSGFCRWIEELANRGVVTGCGGGNYCPTAHVTREQMGVFISVTFGLALYGP